MRKHINRVFRSRKQKSVYDTLVVDMYRLNMKAKEGTHEIRILDLFSLTFSKLC